MFVSRFFKLVGIITLINIAAKVFGFLREITIAFIYGTSYQADSIITAFTIPNFLYTVIGGSVTTAFISVYSKLGKDRRREFTQSVFSIMVVVGSVITILFMLFPSFWMGLFFGKMSEEALTLTSKLFMVTAPATLFLIVSMPLSGLHNVHQNYQLSTFSTLLFNAVYVIIGIALTPLIMEYSYSLGATLGALSMLAILIHYVRKQNLASLRFRIIKMPEMKKLLYLALPLMIGGATLQFYMIIQRIFASGLDEGAISMVNYASKMTQLPQAVLMASVTTIIYPMLAKAAGQGDFAKIKQAYQQGFRMLTIILLPVSLFIFIYAKEIIMIIFQYGSFGEQSTNSTYPLLQIFAISIFSLALNTYITRFYYALENTLLPNLLNVIAVFGINIIVIISLIDEIGASAIALGTVVSTIVNMLFLILFAKTKLDLKICSWGFLIKLSLFIIAAVVVLYPVSIIINQHVILSLFAGGLITGGVVLGGLKFVK